MLDILSKFSLLPYLLLFNYKQYSVLSAPLVLQLPLWIRRPNEHLARPQFRCFTVCKNVLIKDIKFQISITTNNFRIPYWSFGPCYYEISDLALSLLGSVWLLDTVAARAPWPHPLLTSSRAPTIREPGLPAIPDKLFCWRGVCRSASALTAILANPSPSW
jgi:hypothetical protein